MDYIDSLEMYICFIFYTVQPITSELGGLKQQLFIFSQFLGVRNVSTA